MSIVWVEQLIAESAVRVAVEIDTTQPTIRPFVFNDDSIVVLNVKEARVIATENGVGSLSLMFSVGLDRQRSATMV